MEINKEENKFKYYVNKYTTEAKYFSFPKSMENVNIYPFIVLTGKGNIVEIFWSFMKAIIYILINKNDLLKDWNKKIILWENWICLLNKKLRQLISAINKKLYFHKNKEVAKRFILFKNIYIIRLNQLRWIWNRVIKILSILIN